MLQQQFDYLKNYLEENIRILDGAILCPLSSNNEIKEMLIEKKVYNEILYLLIKMKEGILL